MFTKAQVKALSDLELRVEVAKLRGYKFEQNLDRSCIDGNTVLYTILVPMDGGGHIEDYSFYLDLLCGEYVPDYVKSVDTALQLVKGLDFSLVGGYWNRAGEWEAELLKHRNMLEEKIYLSENVNPARAICEVYVLFQQEDSHEAIPA